MQDRGVTSKSTIYKIFGPIITFGCVIWYNMGLGDALIIPAVLFYFLALLLFLCNYPGNWLELYLYHMDYEEYLQLRERLAEQQRIKQLKQSAHDFAIERMAKRKRAAHRREYKKEYKKALDILK